MKLENACTSGTVSYWIRKHVKTNRNYMRWNMQKENMNVKQTLTFDALYPIKSISHNKWLMKLKRNTNRRKRLKMR